MITEKMIEAAWSAYGEEFKRARSAATNSTTNTDIERSAWKAALEAAERAAWRPISEADKDGEVVLLWKPDERRVGEYLLAGYYDDNGPYAGNWVACAGNSLGYFSKWEGKDQGYPTHFRPLPSPPEAPKGEE